MPTHPVGDPAVSCSAQGWSGAVPVFIVPASAAHQWCMTTTARPKRTTGSNPARYRAALELRRSSAAQPHRHRFREAARGLGKGGRGGSRAALRRLVHR